MDSNTERGARAWTSASLTEFLARENKSEPWHNRRFITTFEHAWPAVQQAGRILDVGGRSPFTGMLETFTSAAVSCDPYDLRGPFPYADATFDVVFCLEVIEHLKDRDSSDLGVLATYTASGLRNCLGEIRRVLKPGGLLVLSTPNVGSLRSVRNVLEHRHPFGFALHNRELALTDVQALLTEARLAIESLTTFNAWWNGGGSWWKARLALVLVLGGYSVRNRSDAILALARRPSA